MRCPSGDQTGPLSRLGLVSCAGRCHRIDGLHVWGSRRTRSCRSDRGGTVCVRWEEQRHDQRQYPATLMARNSLRHEQRVVGGRLGVLVGAAVVDAQLVDRPDVAVELPRSRPAPARSRLSRARRWMRRGSIPGRRARHRKHERQVHRRGARRRRARRCSDRGRRRFAERSARGAAPRCTPTGRRPASRW